MTGVINLLKVWQPVAHDMEVNGEMKKTIKRILAIVMAMCVIFAYSGVAMADPKPGEGQVSVHIHVKSDAKFCDNKAEVKLTLEDGRVFTAVYNGSVLDFNMGSMDNIIIPTDDRDQKVEVRFEILSGKTNLGNTGTMVITHLEGNGGSEHDKGLNNYKTESITFDSPVVLSIDVSKEWNDGNNQDEIRPASVEVVLVAGGTDTDKTLTLNSDNDWTGSFDNLPEKKDGVVIDYSVQEVNVRSGYTPSYSGDVENGFVITNTHEPTTRDITVSKVWNDGDNQDGKRPDSVRVQLYADNEECGDPVTLSEENGWSYTYKQYEKYRNEGDAIQLISYTLKELGTDELKEKGYDSSVEGNADSGFIVKNSHTPETISISGTRPGKIVVNLIKQVGNNDPVKAGEVEVTADNNGEWKYEFADLPKYENGRLITYTITENKVDKYQTEINGYDIKNTYAPDKTSVSVTKVWNDANNQDGKRPDSVRVQLYADGTPYENEVELKAGSWSHTFNNLPKYKADGKTAVNYTVKEIAVAGYQSAITGSMSDGYTITNTHTPETIAIRVTKAWNDNNNEAKQRPDKITVKLLKGLTEINSSEVYATSADADGNWQYAFTNLPKYENGTEINYSIEEVVVPGYDSAITGDAANGFVITNTYTPEEGEGEIPVPPGPLGPIGPVVDPDGPGDIPTDEPGSGDGDGTVDVDPAGDEEIIDDEKDAPSAMGEAQAEPENRGVQTGDVTDMYIWLTIFGAALVSAAAVAGTSRRRNEN